MVLIDQFLDAANWYYFGGFIFLMSVVLIPIMNKKLSLTVSAVSAALLLLCIALTSLRTVPRVIGWISLWLGMICIPVLISGLLSLVAVWIKSMLKSR